jgi:acyl-CoA synthetase (AMP-forming)/AMP-acid ligase II
VRIIPACDEPISELSETTFLTTGEIGEIVVRSPSATREYFRRPEATKLAKIPDGERFWHRMGDVGYLDERGRLWFCGRKAHTVFAEAGPMYTIPCEAIFNNHPRIFRSALVGIGPKGLQRQVIVAEPEVGRFPTSKRDEETLRRELLELGKGVERTRSIETILFHRSLPVDIRHNVKIFREKLGPWAEKQLR